MGDVGTHEIRVEIAGRVIYGERATGWGLLPGALDGWWESATSYADEVLIPGADGAFDPQEVLLEPRRVSILGAVVSSSADWSILRDRTWLASLSKLPDLGFRVRAGGQWLSLRNAKLRGRPKVSPDVFGNRFDFEITVWAADPRKYGAERSFVVDAASEPSGGLVFPIVDGSLDFGTSGAVFFPGAFQIHNPGTAEFYPTFRVRGPVAGFTITSESSVIEYAAPVPAGQVLTLSPYSGGRAVLDGADVSHNLLQAGWVPVAGGFPRGETRGYLFTPVTPGLGSQLEVSYPEGAWL